MKSKFYFHTPYDGIHEFSEVYSHLTPAQAQEAYDASYEVTLVYNFDTHEWELP